ncbi:MAG: hypothetical protein BWK79_00140 [Beggiatoa sp. IS2]|nr:MAG: hypothetical protein BWK78_00030 [Thiotrichaceae bacterium IS1]OQW96063.1 MAG: hypothetical protein BWK79_00140 [Beggiatoa sp. IS2]
MAHEKICFKKSQLLVAAEASYGVDPGSGYTAILTNSGIGISPQSDRVARDVVRATFTPLPSITGATHWQLTATTELKGGGIDSTLQLPEIDLLLRGCAMERQSSLIVATTGLTGTFTPGETVQNTTQTEDVGIFVYSFTIGATTTLFLRGVTNPPTAADALEGADSGATATVSGTPETAYCYRPTSNCTGMTSLTQRFEIDGTIYKATGALGTVEFNAQVGQFPTAAFTFSGLYNDPADQALSAVTYNRTKPERCVNMGLQIGNVDMAKLTATALQCNIANDVQPVDDINATEGRSAIDITGRKPTGSVDPSATSLATFNPWNYWKNNVSVGIHGKVGNAAGNKIWFVLPNCQPTEVGHQDRNGRLAYNLPFELSGDGDDELFLFFA